MAMHGSTTPPTEDSPEASLKTTRKSWMLSVKEMEAIELRQLEEMGQRLIAKGVIKPDPTA